jgi:hypothetical protein
MIWQLRRKRGDHLAVERNIRRSVMAAKTLSLLADMIKKRGPEWLSAL